MGEDESSSVRLLCPPTQCAGGRCRAFISISVPMCVRARACVCLYMCVGGGGGVFSSAFPEER